MTTKPVTNYKIDPKTGRLVRIRPYRAKNKALKADREVKAWQKKTPPKRG